MSTKTLKPFKQAKTFIGICLATLIVSTGAAQACCSCPTQVRATESEEWNNPGSGTVDEINQHVTDEFVDHRQWFIQIFWEDNLLPAMQKMTTQLTATALQQTMILGTFMDAAHQMETQQLYQEIKAQARKDYEPSAGLCEFGSSVQSLAQSARNADVNTIALSQISQDRQLGNTSSSAAGGDAKDKEVRLEQYKENFIEIKDNNDGLSALSDTSASPKERRNRDIDFARSIDFANTLDDVDFTDGVNTDEEENIVALANNLYGHTLFTRSSPGDLEKDPNIDINDATKKYMDARAIVAKRSVAENSFNAIVGMKTEGTADSRPFLLALLTDLGIPSEEAEKMLGENPSYDRQMKTLTQSIYQNPDFYTNLYDTPVNVERKGVAMQAIGLMQKFDMFKSHLRSEANMAVLLELAVANLQRDVENQINPTTAGQRPAEE